MVIVADKLKVQSAVEVRLEFVSQEDLRFNSSNTNIPHLREQQPSHHIFAMSLLCFLAMFSAVLALKTEAASDSSDQFCNFG